MVPDQFTARLPTTIVAAGHELRVDLSDGTSSFA